MLPLVAAVGARLLAPTIGRAVATRAITAGFAEASAAQAGQLASRATVMGGNYAAQRIAQRQAEHRSPRPGAQGEVGGGGWVVK